MHCNPMKHDRTRQKKISLLKRATEETWSHIMKQPQKSHNYLLTLFCRSYSTVFTSIAFFDFIIWKMFCTVVYEISLILIKTAANFKHFTIMWTIALKWLSKTKPYVLVQETVFCSCWQWVNFGSPHIRWFLFRFTRKFNLILKKIQMFPKLLYVIDIPYISCGAKKYGNKQKLS